MSAAYQKRASQFHPQAVSLLSEVAQEKATALYLKIREARYVLSDPQSRQEYLSCAEETSGSSCSALTSDDLKAEAKAKDNLEAAREAHIAIARLQKGRASGFSAANGGSLKDIFNR